MSQIEQISLYTLACDIFSHPSSRCRHRVGALVELSTEVEPLTRRILFIDQPSAFLDGRIPVTASHPNHDRRSKSHKWFQNGPRVCKRPKSFSALGGVSRAVMKILRALLKHDVHGLLYAHKSWSPVRLLGTFRSFRTNMPELHRRIRVSFDTRLKKRFRVLIWNLYVHFRIRLRVAGLSRAVVSRNNIRSGP